MVMVLDGFATASVKSLIFPNLGFVSAFFSRPLDAHSRSFRRLFDDFFCSKHYATFNNINHLTKAMA